ncbi:MAG: apolipoprotein N-acyltransferase, partial [Kordiimonadaceae bacterium]|nr:apolipoprotein N-acyltransferase [Kordiimonadaceae bacterium]
MKKSIISIDDVSKFFDQLSAIRRGFLLMAAGLLSALAFAPYYIFPTYFISFPILLIATMNSRSFKAAFICGYMFGIGHFFAGLYWIGNSFTVEPDVPSWLGYPMVMMLAALLAVFVGLVTLLVKYVHKNHSIKTHRVNVILTFIVAWSISEWLRGHIFTGFPWNLSGYIWGFSDAILQSTAIWGIYGLTTVTMCLSFIPFLMLDKRCRIGAGVFGIVILSGLLVYGNDRLPDEIEYVEGIKLKIVQPNINQEDKWAYNNWGKNLVKYMDMSEVDENDAITHVIWPETAVIYSLYEEPFRRQLISQILEPGGKLLTGFPRRQRDPGATKIYNSLIAINETGEIEGFYDKSHLVPFGEYVPSFVKNIIQFMGLEKIFPGGLDFSVGPGVRTLDIPGLPPVGVLICYEVIFPGQVAAQANRPEWLLNITNDAWYGESSGPYQHFLQTRVRAIEEGMPVVRSAGTGISAVIDPYGRTLHKVLLNNRGVINSELPKPIATITI